MRTYSFGRAERWAFCFIRVIDQKIKGPEEGVKIILGVMKQSQTHSTPGPMRSMQRSNIQTTN
jgi:hypothetical protein